MSNAADVMQEEVQALVAAGANAYLAKPVSLRDVMRLSHQIMQTNLSVGASS